VLKGAWAASIRYYSNFRDGKLTSADVRNMATATGILFEHANELGMFNSADKLVGKGSFHISPGAIKLAQKMQKRLRHALPGIDFSGVNAAAKASPGDEFPAPPMGARAEQAQVLADLGQIADRIESHGIKAVQTLVYQNGAAVRIVPVGWCGLAEGLCAGGAVAFAQDWEEELAWCVSTPSAVCICAAIAAGYGAVCGFAAYCGK